MSESEHTMEDAQAAILEKLRPPEPPAPEEEPDRLEAAEEEPEEALEEPQEATDEEPQEELEAAEEGEELPEGVYDFDPALKIRVPTEDGFEDMSLEELRSGSLRQKDYTQKTQALAEQRKMTQEALQQVQSFADQMQTVRTELESNLGKYKPSPQQLAELQQADPGQFALYKLQEQEQADRLVRAKQMEEAARDAVRQQQIPQERAALQQSLPHAFGGDRFDTEYAALGQWAVTEGGVDPQLWSETVDHHLIRLVWEAREHRRTASSAPKLRKKIKGLPKVVRPGASQPDSGQSSGRQERAAMERLQESGSVDAAADALRARFAQRSRRQT